MENSPNQQALPVFKHNHENYNLENFAQILLIFKEERNKYSLGYTENMISNMNSFVKDRVLHIVYET